MLRLIAFFLAPTFNSPLAYADFCSSLSARQPFLHQCQATLTPFIGLFIRALYAHDTIFASATYFCQNSVSFVPSDVITVFLSFS